MFEWISGFIGHVLGEIVCYQIGRWTLLILTGGQYDTSQRGTNEGLVELLGFLMVVVLIFALVLFSGAWA